MMDYCLFLQTVFVGLFLGGFLGFSRGNEAESKQWMTFVYGAILGGSASPFLVVEDTSGFRFHVCVLAGLSFGAVVGLIGMTWFMQVVVYEKEAKRAVEKDKRAVEMEQAKNAPSKSLK